MRKISLIAALATFIAASSAYADKEFSFPKSDSFKSESVKTIRVDMPYGQIAFDKSKSGDIEVYFKNIVYAHDQDEANRLNRDVKYEARINGDKLDITVGLPRHHRNGKGVLTRILEGDWSQGNNPMIKISVPDGKLVDVASSSADIDATDVTFDLDVHSASSDISLENTIGQINCDISSGDVDITGHRGPVSIKGNSSDLRLSDVEGNVDTYTASGDGDFDKIKGDVKIAAASGDYRIFDVGGGLDIRTASGDVYANSVSGSVHAESASGDMRFNALADKSGDFDFTSVSGNVAIEISREFGGELYAKSASGAISSHVAAELDRYSESQLQGTVGKGKGRINITTLSGDINIGEF